MFGFAPLMAAQPGPEGDGGGAGGGTQPPAGSGTPPASAAAAHGDGGGANRPADIDLSKMSDEDYAKAVIPDAKDGEPEADRSLITPMAKELREMGVQPAQMAKIASLYAKTVRAELAKDEAAREERMRELNAKCEREVTAEEWKNFSAAYKDHIAQDAELKHIVDHTELGSNPAFIKLIALAGATLRVETVASPTGASGSSQHDTDRGVFLATVPKDLR